MGSSGSRCTKRYLATTNKKREKRQQKGKKKKQQEIGHSFLIDFLFFIPHYEKKKNLYIYLYLRKKNGQTPELARDDWLESLLAEEVNVTVVVNHFLLLRLHWDICL